MATSGTITGSFNGSNAQYLTFRCEWSVTSQDLANKTSNVRLRWIVTKTTSNLYTNKSSTPWSQVCDSATTSGTLSFNLGNVGANTDYVVRDTTVTIAHNTDGAKTASINGTLDLSGTSAGTGTFSGSMALPTIATTPPTVSSLQLSDVGTTPSSVSAYVAGFTKFKLTATASAVSSATIASYAFYNGNTLLYSGTSNTFTYSSANTAGSYTFKVIVTDSYGNSTTKTNSAVTVVSYSVPTVSATTFRCNSSGTADGSGTYASLKMTWTIANISGNSATVHKVNFNGSDTTLTSGTAVLKSGLSTTTSYTATYTVTDSFGSTATVSQTVQSEFINFDLYPNSTTGGMGVGMTAESGQASFNMLIHAYQAIRADSAILSKTATPIFSEGKLIIVPQLYYGDLTPGSTSANAAFFQAWMKRVCALYPDTSYALFVGLARPNSSGMIFYMAQSTAVNSSGYPDASCGVYYPISSGGHPMYFGTSGGSPYYYAS